MELDQSSDRISNQTTDQPITPSTNEPNSQSIMIDEDDLEEQWKHLLDPTQCQLTNHNTQSITDQLIDHEELPSIFSFYSSISTRFNSINQSFSQTTTYSQILSLFGLN